MIEKWFTFFYAWPGSVCGFQRTHTTKKEFTNDSKSEANCSLSHDLFYSSWASHCLGLGAHSLNRWLVASFIMLYILVDVAIKRAHEHTHTLKLMPICTTRPDDKKNVYSSYQFLNMKIWIALCAQLEITYFRSNSTTLKTNPYNIVHFDLPNKFVFKYIVRKCCDSFLVTIARTSRHMKNTCVCIHGRQHTNK